MKFELLPTKDNPGFWDVWNADTGEQLDWCASANMALCAIRFELRKAETAQDQEDNQ